MDLKYPKPVRLARIARWLASSDARGHFSSFFGPRVALVPAPSHAPLTPSHRERISPTGELVAALAREGLGYQSDWLKRDEMVNKSAWADRGRRPTAEDHYRSISVRTLLSLGLERARRITVVDDVITTGATLYACVRLIAEAVPAADVQAFALVRTRGDLDQVLSVMDAVSRGTITLKANGRTQREP